MKVREDRELQLDFIVYVLLVIASFGAVWFARVVMTRAIRLAFKQ